MLRCLHSRPLAFLVINMYALRTCTIRMHTTWPKCSTGHFLFKRGQYYLKQRGQGQHQSLTEQKMAPDTHRWDLLYIKHACKYSLVRPFKWKIWFRSKVYENVVSRGSPPRIEAMMITGRNTQRGLGRTLRVVLHVWLWDSDDTREINDGHLSDWTDLELCTMANGM